MKCKECKYYESTKQRLPVDTGYCHRYPPTREEDEVYEEGGFHVVVDGNDWCGEFKKKVVKGEYPKRPNITPEHVAL